MRWTEGHLAASQRPWRRRPRRGRSAWHACGWVSREPGRPRRLHRTDRRGAGTGSPRPRPWTSPLASDGANRRCSDGTAGRRQRSAGGWAARSRRVSEYRRSGGIEPTRPRGGKGAPAGGTVGGKDGQHTEVGSRLHVTTTDSRTGQTSRRDGGGHRLASWTSGYATARSDAVCRGAGCGRTRTSGSVGGQGQQRPWSTRPQGVVSGHARLGRRSPSGPSSSGSRDDGVPRRRWRKRSCVIDLNTKFAGVVRFHDPVRRHECPVHGDPNLGDVLIPQRGPWKGNTAAAPTGRIGDE